jgi:hypothetical protein
MKMNLIEMDGFLRGKCLPGDMLINETNAEYLVRKFAAIEAERDALAAENSRYSISAGQADQRMAESCSVRAALGFNPDAEDVSPSDLVESINKIVADLCAIRSAHPQPLGAIMDSAIDAFNSAEMPETGMLNAFFILRDSIRVETPATDRFSREMQAQGVEMFALMFAEEAIKDNNITTGWKARASRAASEYAELLRGEEKA